MRASDKIYSKPFPTSQHTSSLLCTLLISTNIRRTLNLRQAYIDVFNRSDWLSRAEAANLEYNLFQVATTVMGYRASVVKRINEIKKQTQEKSLHRLFILKQETWFVVVRLG